MIADAAIRVNRNCSETDAVPDSQVGFNSRTGSIFRDGMAFGIFSAVPS
ncbi:MAG: hypothetical protein ACKO23_00710 [Gemmataceae bacterium]